MKVSYLLLISLLIVGMLFVPAVSAETFSEDEFTSWAVPSTTPLTWQNSASFSTLWFKDIGNYPALQAVTLIYPDGVVSNDVSASAPFVAKIGTDVIGSGTITYNKNYNAAGTYISTVISAQFDEWDHKSYTGTQIVTLTIDTSNGYNLQSITNRFSSRGLIHEPQAVGFYRSIGGDSYLLAGALSAYGRYTWAASVDYSDGFLDIKRYGYQSYIKAYNKDVPSIVYYSNSSTEDISSINCMMAPVITVNITSPKGNVYSNDYPLNGESIPQPTPEQLGLRTGTVTMTDHNGTSISGFEVTAVNHYTGETYTVPTDTDVAVMTLPMDRTTEIRNPQTGVYEESPIGYYRFYGQSPGYKMLNEDGIQVAVMPEKYGTYKLCDIGVTSESGYLTGKHQFQIRSRSDNSILQSGTISAKSATTGEWYNTTVSGGIATLILPYDTSNAISQYAGNYYVYPTSPGYEDNDFGTQITVMPHTVSEIKTIFLTPIGGIPTPGNVTLRIYAFSETGPGVVNAEIFISGVIGEGASVWDTYTASSTGYLAVSVPGNSTYVIQASGDGYYDTSQRIEVFTEDPPLIELKLYLSGAPTQEPTTPPTGWPTDHPTTQPPGGIPDEDDDSEGFLMQAVRGIGLAFGVGFATAKLIFGMLLALSIGYATAKQLRGGAAEFGLGLLGGTLLGVLIGLLPVWIIVVLLLVVGLYIGNRYVGGANNG